MVTNRNDPDLARRIEERFAFASVDLCDIAPRRVEAAAKRVGAGTYDFVLAATGFLPHKVDGSLEQACRDTATLYVRVNRGRPHACIHHLARELGVRLPRAQAG